MARKKRVDNDIHTNISYSQVDFWLLLSVVLLVGIGTMMIFSASTPSSYSKTPDSTAYDVLKTQIVYTVVGIAILFVVSMADYKYLQPLSLVLFGVATALMAAVFTPLGITLNNARRWIDLKVITFQPSEVLKLAVVFFMAYVLSNPAIRRKAVGLWGILIFVVPIALNVLMLVRQPHISCVLIILLITASMMFAGKVKWYTFAVTIVLGVAAVVAVLLFVKSNEGLSLDYIIKRVAAHGGEAENEADTYQATQSMLAIGSGGLFGRGFGRSVQKYLYLPEPYNDFIFSILAEELGLVGVLLVIVLFIILIMRGYKVSRNAPDMFGALVAYGITTNVAIQVVLNLAVVSKLMPVTGISLPFFSYGGTSLWIMLAGMGVVLNISKQSRYSKF
ncbi:MAG: FtsW/RodA/SpoVE family cell cycle protein [Clostridia bacterium]|nr:FtsW/RodA/SpoVE family cell cycle protein [Clostridia bacterium]